ncbi:hypothetical protein [Fischerella sp. PCC 9605]|uniref:hypothetical protein n=1 Tax=Fischerella sp. PCC 9605 TaxID=1173024 RepID=UPI00047BCEAE|nr:hypothetical protein [Fischerella sp. PCC 9605]
MPTLKERLFAALQAAGMPQIPGEFSVVPWYQEIPQSLLAEIREFIRLFDRVTTRLTWQSAVTADSLEITRHRRPEVCFFSAWDFHLPTEHPSDWQLIEFNDNGSGLFFAGLINQIFYDISGLKQRSDIQPPPNFSALGELVAGIVEAEAKRFFGKFPDGLFLILDDAESLQRGKFRQELILMRDLWRQRGWQTEIASPAEIRWDGRQLLWDEQEVCFIVNRSTDFLWQAEVFTPLRTAYTQGRVYVAPNPFTYATRSDKRLLEFLSLPDRDEQLGIQAEERTMLSAHVPETHLIREDNLEAIARTKEEFFFKPLYGFGGRGVLTGAQVGRSRLHRLLKRGEHYVAQKRVPKFLLQSENIHESISLWTDLRVWAYQGEIFLLSGRASQRPDILDLTPPGGWLPTYAQV